MGNYICIHSCIPYRCSELKFVVHTTCLLKCMILFMASCCKSTMYYPHSPSLSRMVTVAVSPPGTNKDGAATSPETAKLSVPSTKESSMI